MGIEEGEVKTPAGRRSLVALQSHGLKSEDAFVIHAAWTTEQLIQSLSSLSLESSIRMNTA